MASLPPYSSFSTDNKPIMCPQVISHGNVLSFTPPGFNQVLNVKFPDCRLAVCEKCKKNYKTRDMCRVRNGHTEEPWSTAFICITLDHSCTDSDGKYVEKPFSCRMVQWQPFCVKDPFDAKTPVCAACKKTNRTRSFCRERHQHRQLPWCTVYVVLSCADNADGNASNSKEEKPEEDEDEKEDSRTEVKEFKPESELDVHENTVNHEGNSEPISCIKVKHEEIAPLLEVAEEIPETPTSSVTTSLCHPDSDLLPAPGITDPITPSSPDKLVQKLDSISSSGSDDVTKIEESRTFLAKVSCKSITVHWLELAEYDGTSGTMPGLPLENSVQLNMMRNSAMAGLPIDASQYYANMGAMGYAHHQQHQLKMQQQHFLQMQQRQQQHFAAQQAAWHAQYNQQQMTGPQNGQPNQLTAPGPASVPSPGASPSDSAGTAAAAMAAQQQAQWQAHMVYQQQLYQQQLQMQQQGHGGPMMMQHPLMMQPGMTPFGQQQMSHPGQVDGQNQQPMPNGERQQDEEGDRDTPEPEAKRQCV